MKETTIEDVLNAEIKKDTQSEVSIQDYAGANEHYIRKDVVRKAMTEYASLNRQGWTRDELKIYFENNFDCYGDAQGDVVLAMTFEAFEKSFQHWMPLPNKPSI